MNRVYVVGIGPGAGKQMTEEAREVLNACDVIIGYTVYVDLVKEQFPGKEFLTTPMKQEVKRCKMAVGHEREKSGDDLQRGCRCVWNGWFDV